MAVINGTNAGETIDGTDDPDTINGLGGDDTINGYGGADEIHGGAGADDIGGGSGADDLFGDSGGDFIVGGTGADFIDGGIGNDTLRGDEDNDTIFGDLGADDLIGGDGDDQLAGEGGFDRMYGEAGNDLLVISAESDVVDGEIYDGGAGIDGLNITTFELVDLSGVTIANIENLSSFGEVYAKTQQIDGLLYLSTGALTFTDAGTVHLDNKTVITHEFFLSDAGSNSLNLTGDTGAYTVHGASHHDEIYTGINNDIIDGAAGSDRLNGQGGDDDLTGGAGNDTLFGEAGNDRAHFSDISDNYTVTASEEFSDTYIISHLGGSGSDGTDTLVGIENLQFADGGLDNMPWAALGGKPISPANLQLWGNSLLKSGLSGASSVQSFAAATTASAAISASNIAYAGSFSAGQRLADGYDFGSGGGAPLSIGKCMLITTGDGTPPLSNTEFNHRVILGTPGDADLDAVAAAAGRGPSVDASVITLDLTISDPGTKFISFDLIMGSEESSSSSDFGDLAAVFVNGTNYALFDGDPDRILCMNQGFAPTINNALDVLPIEYNGVTKLLNVFAPVHQGDNTLKIAIADLVDREYDSGLFIGNGQGYATGAAGMYVQVKGTAGADSLTGSDLPEQFLMGADKDTVEAGGGNDIVRGEGGNDALIAGSGAGDDLYDGGIGIDRILFSSATQTVTVNLSAASNQAIGAETGTDQIVGVENVTGGSGNDILTGDDLANVLAGGDGNDILAGKKGDDTLNGVAGDDVLKGLAGHDNLDGAAGVDTADYGEKTLAVSVTLNGAAAVSVLVNAVAEDTIKNVENVISGAGDDTLTGDDLANVLTGNQGADTLTGKRGGDLLIGGGGLDKLNGGSGNDVFVYTALTDSGTSALTRDQIFGFASGDKIDVSTIDAIEGGADDAFVPDDGDATFEAGEIRQTIVHGTDLRLDFNANPDPGIDMQILIVGRATLLDPGEFNL